MRYRDEGVPLVVIAGREYGSGSSRDWAAKGTALLGIRAVIAETLRADPPLQPRGHGRAAAPVPARARARRRSACWARESFTIAGLAELAPRQVVSVVARSDDATARSGRSGRSRGSTGPIEVEYLRQGGILPAVLRRLAAD